MKIYVVAHKKVQNPLPKNYEYVQVNAVNNPKIYPLTDDTGDNISAKNPNYCELTASYWIWKNDKENDVVGLAHYRRFFTTNKFSSSYKKYLNSPQIEKDLSRYDFIATKQYKTSCTTKEHLLQSVREKDFDLLRKVFNDYFPEYLNSFDQVFNGRKGYLLNMFICKKPLWDEYYAWLFSVFDKLEPLVDMTGYSIQEQRLYGYLSERLFTVFVKQNNYTVKSYTTHIVGASVIKLAFDKVLKMLRIKD